MSRVVVEGESIAVIYIASSSKMKHNSTSGRGGVSNTGAVTNHHIRVGDGYDAGSGDGP